MNLVVVRRLMEKVSAYFETSSWVNKQEKLIIQLPTALDVQFHAQWL